MSIMVLRPFRLVVTAFVASLFATTLPVLAQPVASEAVSVADDLATDLRSQGISFQTGTFQGFTQIAFQLEGVDCKMVCPKTVAAGKPWVWRARFWGHEPQFDRAMLERGWHVCYCDVGGLFGADPAIERWDAFYSLTQKLGLHAKPFLEGMSRGGLIVLRWASEHPNQVSGIYVDNAVMDIRSWPGGKGAGKGSARDWAQCLKVYGMTDAQSVEFADGPLDRVQPLVDAGVPIFVLINEADDVVPPAENGDRLIAEYKKRGGPIVEMRRAGLGHHPHSLKDPSAIVDFAVAAVNRP